MKGTLCWLQEKTAKDYASIIQELSNPTLPIGFQTGHPDKMVQVVESLSLAEST